MHVAPAGFFCPIRLACLSFVLMGAAPALAQTDVSPASVQPDQGVSSPPLRVPTLPRDPSAATPAAEFAPTINGFVLVDTSYVHSTTPGRETKSRGSQETALINLNITPRLTIGLGGSYSSSEAKLLYLTNGRQDTSGYGAFLSATLNLDDGWVVGGSFGYSGVESRLNRTVANLPSSASFHTRSVLGSAFVSKLIPLSSILYVQPLVRVQFSNSHSDAYLETTGIFSPEKTSVLGRVSAGAQVGLVLPFGDWTVVPSIEASILYDFKRQAYQTDRTGAELRGGFFAVRGDLTVGASANAIVGRSDYARFDGFRAFLNYKFGLPTPSRPSAASTDSAYHWAGAYAGINAGYGFTQNACGGFAGGQGCFADGYGVPTFPSSALTPLPSAVIGLLPGSFDNRRLRDGFAGGGQIGVNFQPKPGSGLVYGLEYDTQYVDFGNRRTIAVPGAFGSSGLYAAGLVLPAVSIFPNGGGFGVAPGTGTAAIGGSNVALFGNGVQSDRRGADWFGTIRGRIGYAFDRFMVFGTAGVAFTDRPSRSKTSSGYANGAAVPAEFYLGPASIGNGAMVAPTGGSGDTKGSNFGYAIGGGIEYAVTDSLSVKLDGLYVNFGRTGGLAAGSVIGVTNTGAPVTLLAARSRTQDDFSLVRAGVNYRFSTF